MNSFQTTYPALYALINLLAGVAKGMAVQGETLVQKLEGEAMELPSLVSFLPLAGSIGAEIEAIKSSPGDIVGAAECLVTDLAFTSAKAQAVINAAFPLANSIAALVPQVTAVVAAIKA
jgi:hypothetical protein